MNPWRGLKDIPRNVWLVSFTTLINRSGTMVLPFLVIYMIREIGTSTTSAGLVLAFYGAGALVTAPFVGKLADKVGNLKVMKFSLFATGIILIIYSFIKNYNAILVITLIWSVISEAFRPANLSLISNESSPEQRKTAFALNRLAINLGMSVGPVIGGFLSMINFSLLFYVNGFTSILAGIFLTISHFEEHKPILHFENDSKQELIIADTPKHKTILKDKKMLLFIIALIPVEMVFFQHIGGLPLYVIRDLGYATSTYGLLMSINTILIILIEVPLNNSMANWEDRKAISLGAFLCAVGFGSLIFFNQLWFIAFTVIIWTFGEMIFFPSTTTYISTHSPVNRRGEYMGYFQMSFSFSLMAGPWLGTLVYSHFGSTILWELAFVFGIISTILFLFLKIESVLDYIK